MPNWCYNRVDISGEPEEMDEFREFISSEESAFDFNKVKPMPKELLEVRVPRIDKSPEAEKLSKELKEKYGDDNWYDWALSNWGVKWDVTVSKDDVTDEGDYIQYAFDTAWGPPHEIYKAIREKFPNLGITWFYDEPGMEFAGYLNNE
jgi:hypothetical protein